MRALTKFVIFATTSAVAISTILVFVTKISCSAPLSSSWFKHSGLNGQSTGCSSFALRDCGLVSLATSKSHPRSRRRASVPTTALVYTDLQCIALQRTADCSVPAATANNSRQLGVNNDELHTKPPARTQDCRPLGLRKKQQEIGEARTKSGMV